MEKKYERKNGDIVVFDNEERKRDDKDPDFAGDIMLDGKLYWVNLYWKFPKDESKKALLSGYVGKEKKPR